MADRWVDHGAYRYTGAGNITVSGSTMTVTGFSGGKISRGSIVSGVTGVGPVCVTGFGTGVGGNGTYTLNQSLTVGSSTAVTFSDGLPCFEIAPTWGVPEDGDGTLKAASTASAVTSLDMSGATAAAGNTISIMGATLTCVASGAGNNQFNAGSGATLVANIVTAINRAANTVTVAAQATGWPTPRVQDAVFARAGSPTTTLEIMTRAGSATYNGLTAIAWSGITGLSGTPTWSGGVSGCWGHLTQHVTAWPSGRDSNSPFGVWGANLLAGLLVDAAQAGHRVYVRSNKTVRVAVPSVQGNLLFGAQSWSTNALAQTPLIFQIDDSTEWADGADPVLTVLSDTGGTGPGSTRWMFGTGIPNTFVVGKRYSSGVRNLKFRQTGTTGLNDAFYTLGGVSTINAEFDWATAAITCQFRWYFINISNPLGYQRIQGALVKMGPGTAPIFYISGSGADGSAIVDMTDIEYDGSIFVAAHPGLIGDATAISSTSPFEMTWTNVKFSNFVAGSRLYQTGQQQSAQFQLNCSDVSWGNVTVRGPSFLTGYVRRKLSRLMAGTTYDNSGDFFVDSPAGYVDWTSGLGFPTLNARLLDGTTPWSLRVIPTTTAANIGQNAPLELPKLVKQNTLGANILSVTFEFAVEQSLSFDTRDISLTVFYVVAATGEKKVVSSYDFAAGGSLTTSSVTWSSESGGQVAFYPGPILHNKRKIVVTTPTTVQANSMVVGLVRITKSVSAQDKSIFCDPDLTLAVV